VGHQSKFPRTTNRGPGRGRGEVMEPVEIPRIRSGFRRAAQRPRKRLKFRDGTANLY